MTYEETKAEVFREMDRIWPHNCAICGARPVWVYALRSFYWDIYCPNRRDEKHRKCMTIPHSVGSPGWGMSRDAWNKEHVYGRALEGPPIWAKLGQPCDVR